MSSIPTSYDGSCNPIESWINDGWVSGDTSVVKTELSSFKFVTSKVHRYCSSRSCTSTVSYQVEVYRNGILIDTINDIPNGMTIPAGTPGSPPQCIGTELGGACGPNPSGQRYYRAYSDDGQIYKGDEVTPRLFTEPTKVELPSGKTGINVVFGSYTYVADRRCEYYPSVSHKIEIVGTTSTLSTNEFSNINGIMVFEGEEFPADVTKHSTIKITKAGGDDDDNGGTGDSNTLMVIAGIGAGIAGLLIILRRIKK